MKILYICTHNRCRSILSEAITQHMGKGKIQAFSAGSQPVGQVHPLSLKYLKQKGFATKELKSQSWNDFESEDVDIVITVCDSAANEVCPIWFGNTAKIHWGLPDPSKLEGSDDEIRDAFFRVMGTIEERVRVLLSLNLTTMSREQRQSALSDLVKA